MAREAPPLAEGQLGFPLERREIVASLGKEKAGSTWGGLFTIVSALGMAQILPRIWHHGSSILTLYYVPKYYTTNTLLQHDL